jgi:hypothetical protein
MPFPAFIVAIRPLNDNFHVDVPRRNGPSAGRTVADGALHTAMAPDLERVIRQALPDARAAGGDYLGETEKAVQAVLRTRPDMTAPEALPAINLVRRS